MGTDYGAPIGTPVQTIGSGRVEFAGRKGGEGNMVQIVHSDGYQTMYLHLSRMFVHQGERVEIGKTIGLVGSSGLSTGPHLDFRILQRGQYKNFEKLGLPRPIRSPRSIGRNSRWCGSNGSQYCAAKPRRRKPPRLHRQAFPPRLLRKPIQPKRLCRWFRSEMNGSTETTPNTAE